MRSLLTDVSSVYRTLSTMTCIFTMGISSLERLLWPTSTPNGADQHLSRFVSHRMCSDGFRGAELTSHCFAQPPIQILLLIRCIANPSEEDEYFPTWRHKDWYQGHSWASGIAVVFLNGKNQESSSESISAYEAIALYGRALVRRYVLRLCLAPSPRSLIFLVNIYR
jgi:Glycosyl hydrolase family 81 C-terminal domain